MLGGGKSGGKSVVGEMWHVAGSRVVLAPPSCGVVQGFFFLVAQYCNLRKLFLLESGLYGAEHKQATSNQWQVKVKVVKFISHRIPCLCEFVNPEDPK